jgi:hypothetical protein
VKDAKHHGINSKRVAARAQLEREEKKWSTGKCGKNWGQRIVDRQEKKRRAQKNKQSSHDCSSLFALAFPPGREWVCAAAERRRAVSFLTRSVAGSGDGRRRHACAECLCSVENGEAEMVCLAVVEQAYRPANGQFAAVKDIHNDSAAPMCAGVLGKIVAA